ncbi:MAG: hypothetical protein OIF32_11595 [Campylobacterales bacterium]|nr:hypothetical protein [Campylobacterales bacterium]
MNSAILIQLKNQSCFTYDEEQKKFFKNNLETSSQRVFKDLIFIAETLSENNIDFLVDHEENIEIYEKTA